MTTARDMQVPVKSEKETGYGDEVRAAIRKAMDEMGIKPRELYVLLYGTEPEGNQEQTLRNRLNRGNPGADFIGLCVKALPPLQKLKASELFGVKKPSQQ